MNSFASTSSIPVQQEYGIGSLLAVELPHARSASISNLSVEKVRLLPMDHESLTHQPGKERLTDPLQRGDFYETQPLSARELVVSSSNEEDLHTSFELALHERLVVIRERLKQLNTPRPRSGRREAASDVVTHQPGTPSRKALSFLSQTPGQIFSVLSAQRWVSWLLFWSFTFMCLLIGFDAMGLFILCKR